MPTYIKKVRHFNKFEKIRSIKLFIKIHRSRNSQVGSLLRETKRRKKGKNYCCDCW